ncbi:MAG: 30S ribosomal protein S17e [Nanoarchaeota archaeon]
MGRIRPTAVKRVGKKLFQSHPGKFTADFEANKKSIAELVEYKSKKLRNVLAGYMVKLARISSEGKSVQAKKLEMQ